MNGLIRQYLYRALKTSYEYKPDDDTTHIISKFDYDNFAKYIIQDSIKFLEDKGYSDLAKELQSHWDEYEI